MQPSASNCFAAASTSAAPRRRAAHSRASGCRRCAGPSRPAGRPRADRAPGPRPNRDRARRSRRIAMNSSAASSTVRAIGPTWASVVVADTGHTGMRPNWPLMAASPVRQPGMRIEPPPSVPSANGVMPAGDRGGRAGARAARRLAEIPRIAGDAGERAVADRLAAELAGGGLADQDARRPLARARPTARRPPRHCPPCSASRRRSARRRPRSGPWPRTARRAAARAASPRITASSAAFAAAIACSGISRKKALSEACVASALLERPARRPRPARARAARSARAVRPRSLHRSRRTWNGWPRGAAVT